MKSLLNALTYSFLGFVRRLVKLVRLRTVVRRVRPVPAPARLPRLQGWVGSNHNGRSLTALSPHWLLLTR